MKKLISVAMACFCAICHSAGLGVNMENLELQYEITSMALPWGSIEHQYKSRNRYRNSLGLGWCNAIHLKSAGQTSHIDLESHALIERDGVTIVNCGTRKEFGEAIRFEPDAISKPRISTAGLKEYASSGADVLLKSPETPDVIQANKDGIFIDNKLYDWGGRLTRVGNIQITNDDGGRAIKLESPDGQNVEFSYDGARLKMIKGPGGIAAEFYYNKEQLARLNNAWLKDYLFAYSEGLNLQKIEYPDKTSHTFFYDEPRDVITGLLNRNGCMETYSVISGLDSNRYKVQSMLMCDGKKKMERTLLIVFDEKGYIKERSEQTTDDSGNRVVDKHFQPYH